MSAWNVLGSFTVPWSRSLFERAKLRTFHKYLTRTEVRYYLQYIPRNMHTVFALLCFVVVIHWLIFPYPSGLLHWHCGNLTIAPVPAKQPWWKWMNTSYEFIMNDCITTTKLSTTKPCAYFLGYTVSYSLRILNIRVKFRVTMPCPMKQPFKRTWCETIFIKQQGSLLFRVGL